MAVKRIDYARDAQKSLNKLAKSNPQAAEDIINKIALLAETPAPFGAVKLHGGETEYMRIRSGAFRVIYYAEGNAIKITDIGHRKEVYRKHNRRK